MSSDSRWTGGLANREWQAGTRIDQPVDRDYIAAQVRRYLRDCDRFRLVPSQVTCLKVVFHANGAQEAAVTGAFREICGRTAEPP